MMLQIVRTRLDESKCVGRTMFAVVHGGYEIAYFREYEDAVLFVKAKQGI